MQGVRSAAGLRDSHSRQNPADQAMCMVPATNPATSPRAAHLCRAIMTPPARQAISHMQQRQGKDRADKRRQHDQCRRRGQHGHDGLAGAGRVPYFCRLRARPRPKLKYCRIMGPRRARGKGQPSPPAGQPDTMARGCQPVVQFGILVVAEARVIAAHRPKGVDPHQA